MLKSVCSSANSHGLYVTSRVCGIVSIDARNRRVGKPGEATIVLWMLVPVRPYMYQSSLWAVSLAEPMALEPRRAA